MEKVTPRSRMNSVCSPCCAFKQILFFEKKFFFPSRVYRQELLLPLCQLPPQSHVGRKENFNPRSCNVSCLQREIFPCFPLLGRATQALVFSPNSNLSVSCVNCRSSVCLLSTLIYCTEKYKYKKVCKPPPSASQSLSSQYLYRGGYRAAVHA